LVSILKAEEGLFLPHYKSGERIFQLLMQAEGRAGRKREKGKVIFQSSIKDHYAIKYALKQDYEKFYEEEIKLRKRFLFPPFVRLVVIRIEGIKEEKVKEKCIEAKKYLENLFSEMKIKDTEIMGPAPCPFRKLKGFYRWHIILKTKNYKPINNILFKFLTNFKVVGLKLNVDIDPEDLL
ncbi:MAG: primosomal protein N', partial [Thermodesulfobacterium geofontis]